MILQNKFEYYLFVAVVFFFYFFSPHVLHRFFSDSLFCFLKHAVQLFLFLCRFLLIFSCYKLWLNIFACFFFVFFFVSKWFTSRICVVGWFVFCTCVSFCFCWFFQFTVDVSFDFLISFRLRLWLNKTNYQREQEVIIGIDLIVYVCYVYSTKKQLFSITYDLWQTSCLPIQRKSIQFLTSFTSNQHYVCIARKFVANEVIPITITNNIIIIRTSAENNNRSSIGFGKHNALYRKWFDVWQRQ